MFMIKSVAVRRLCGNCFVTRRAAVTVIEDGAFGQKGKFGHRSSNCANGDIEELRIGASLFEDDPLVHKPVIAKQMLQKKTKWVADSNTQTSLKQKKRDKKKHYQTEVIDDPELGLEFLQLYLHDPILSTLMTTVRSRKRREKKHEIIVEGWRFIREAVECQLQLLSIIFSQKEQLRLVKDSIVQAQSQQTIPAKIYKVPHHDLKMWSTLTTPPGVLALFQRPSAQCFDDVKLATSRLPITVVCDNIREPNNLGSIIRTCAALPCYQVVVTRGCCNPWESKALRGGCGGQFRIPIRDEVDWENLPSFIPTATADNCCVFIAENNVAKTNGMPNSAIVNYLEIGRTGVHNVVVIGGESHGVSEQAYRFLNVSGHRGKCLYIPLANGVESLNVTSALTLILYELRKNLLNHPMQKIHHK